MRVIIKSARILWEHSPYHQLTKDILIENGQVAEVADRLEDPEAVEWVCPGSYISPGWFDLDASFGEPGFETREDMVSGARAALRGGFTGLALMPNTFPPFHSRTEIEYVLTKSNPLPVDLYPIGSISKNRDGKELAELYDMYQAGARAFCDGDRSVQHAGLLLRALQYSASFGGRIFSFPEDSFLAGSAKVHEGLYSLQLGLKGIPTIAEDLMVQRDLTLAAYAETSIHFTALSTRRSVELVRRAKANRQPVTASVPAYQLHLSDEKLTGFDTNYKVRPPLRSLDDVAALVEGIRDGTLDTITSHHTPQEKEFKEVEFENALDGMVSLETSFSVATMGLSDQVPIERLINAFTQKPRAILGITQPTFTIGSAANLCWFHPDQAWVFTPSSEGSKSANTPFTGQELKGRVLGIIHKNQYTKF